jgi:molybdate transport system substrate-binding protein
MQQGILPDGRPYRLQQHRCAQCRRGIVSEIRKAKCLPPRRHLGHRDALRKQSKVLAGTDVTLAGSGVAIAVKAGKPKPDISTPEALKQTLLKAKSVAYSEPSAGGASGVYFAKLLERMGIAEQMKPKTKYPPAGGFSAELLLTGAAELAVRQKPELLHVSGVEIVGFLPGDLNLVTEFAAAVMTGSENAETSKALIASLRSPGAAAVFRSKGLDPR